MSAAQFMTINTPNTSVPDQNVCVDLQAPSPCITAGPRIQAAPAAMTLAAYWCCLGDGSVHCVGDSVDLTVWQAAGSMAGGKVESLE